jgi:hypothetical protein
MFVHLMNKLSFAKLVILTTGILLSKHIWLGPVATVSVDEYRGHHR